MQRIVNKLEKQEPLISIESAIKEIKKNPYVLVVCKTDKNEICILTKSKGFGSEKYGWLVLFNETTNHNTYSGSFGYSLKEAIDSMMKQGGVWLVESKKELKTLLK